MCMVSKQRLEELIIDAESKIICAVAEAIAVVLCSKHEHLPDG